jgi:hypothetical protein
MSTWVRFYFDDADPCAECECGWYTPGDSAVDAFRAWWKHRAYHHPDAPAGDTDDPREWCEHGRRGPHIVFAPGRGVEWRRCPGPVSGTAPAWP